MSGRILVALLVVVLTGCASAVAEPATVARQPEVAALAVLHEWEQRRAAAFESADGAAVRDLYAPSSGLAALDLRVLRAYTARGLTVYGIAAQVSEVEVVTFTERRLRVEVTDRLAQAWATTGGGEPEQKSRQGLG
ncbi:MAG: hypothetical protein HZY75_11455 [Nocardioidaceae bacterium]|nr:MAG: hypothetical protein HZY75_11455 [Nocardioidaceae bacterium]